MASHETETTCDTGLTSIIDRVVQSGHRIVNQSRDDIPLTDTEKRELLLKQIHEKPHIFLEKYSSYLDATCCEYFDQVKSSEENDGLVIDYYVSEIRRRSDTGAKCKSNRRYQAMLKLMRETNFFGDSQMRDRDPDAYRSMIGQYLTNEQIDSMITEPVASLHLAPKSKYEQLLETLDDHFGAGDEGSGRGNAEEEFDSESESEEEDCAMEQNTFAGDNSQSANELRKREFLLYMQQKFLHGMEKDVDYEEIDRDDSNDFSLEKERDDEEAWFDQD